MILEQADMKLRELSSFLARLNGIRHHHVGYCGEQEGEIYSTLQTEFTENGELSSQKFTVIYDQDQIVGALGFDVDEEERSAELWGPFIDAEGEQWNRLAEQLWDAGTSKLEGCVNRYYGFYNVDHQSAVRFMEDKGGRKSGEHHVLRLRKSALLTDGLSGLQDFTPEYTDEFAKLHGTNFPNTYLSAQDIMQQLDDDHRLFMFTEQGELAGYVYVEGEPEFKEGSIEYIAVSENFRGKGYGRALLDQALHYLFHIVQLEDISLCVDQRNEGAIQLYQRAGFDAIHKLAAYVLE
ncbi:MULTISPECIES: GNAT family N-acetyltransferase [Paenibacillus]|uniref:GNAT family N-acetyltransferase n=1 Tax=Paenibacillus lautus TaxID=1401 RepID=A0A1R1B6H0_PAELA|nr:GNAT family N-acetyltransferase [Paenibacillus lautus]OME95128.1 GNAT family N-acetyltransferase [Paenibacillus lautus]